jgi:hypothetical protein
MQARHIFRDQLTFGRYVIIYREQSAWLPIPQLTRFQGPVPYYVEIFVVNASEVIATHKLDRPGLIQFLHRRNLVSAFDAINPIPAG